MQNPNKTWTVLARFQLDCSDPAEAISAIVRLHTQHTTLVVYVVLLSTHSSLYFVSSFLQAVPRHCCLAYMSQDAAYELELDATEATLCAIEEQLEDDSPVMQAQGAHKVYPVFTAHAVT